TMMYSSKKPLSLRNRTADSGVNSLDRNSQTLIRSRSRSVCSGSAISRKGSNPWTSHFAGGSPFCERASSWALTNSPKAQSSNPSINGPVRRLPVKNTPRRGITRPTSSTSPNNAGSSTDGKHSDKGRIVERRAEPSCELKTLLRMRNLNSTINASSNVSEHNQLCCLSRESRTDVVQLRLRLPHDDVH